MKDHVAIVIHRNGQLLFIQRSKEKRVLPNLWGFPSGTVERGEDPKITAEREAQEELGIETRAEKIFATVELPELNTRLIFVLCSILNGEPTIIQPHEIQQIVWMKFEEFLKKFSDEHIGHGLVWLRKNQQTVLESINLVSNKNQTSVLTNYRPQDTC